MMKRSPISDMMCGKTLGMAFTLSWMSSPAHHSAVSRLHRLI